MDGSLPDEPSFFSPSKGSTTPWWGVGKCGSVSIRVWCPLIEKWLILNINGKRVIGANVRHYTPISDVPFVLCNTLYALIVKTVVTLCMLELLKQLQLFVCWNSQITVKTVVTLCMLELYITVKTPVLIWQELDRNIATMR